MKGSDRFKFFLDTLDQLMITAAQQGNPGWWLYKNDARTPAFMVEGLSRIYRSFYDDEIFEKIHDDVKLIEDGIGSIDFYDQLAEELEKETVVDKKYIDFIKRKSIGKSESLNSILNDRKWIGSEKSRIKKIKKKLDEVNWKSVNGDISGLRSYYQHAIKKINLFVEERNGKFSHLEAEVHEYRRKIRWLSIYPKSMNGAIQFSGELSDKPELDCYFTPEIINSPYNIMPSSDGQSALLYLSKPDFFALSWMIFSIGKIKDKGLDVIGLSEAITEVDSLGEDDAVRKAEEILNKDHPDLNEVLKESSELIQRYHLSGSLNQLLA